MKIHSLLAAVLTTLLAFAFLSLPVMAESQDNDARIILKAMSDYVSSQNTIKLTFDSDIEVITPQLEKIQFTNSGEMLLSRPDNMQAHRKGG